MYRKKLTNFLEKSGIDAKIIDTGAETSTVMASSEVLGLSRRNIAKSIVFKSDVGIIIAIMRGDQRVSETKLAEKIGAKKVQLADPKTVEEVTGYGVGGVPPIGHDHPEDVTYVIDQKLLESDKVYAGGGDNRAQLSIRVKDIIHLVNPEVADISE